MFLLKKYNFEINKNILEIKKNYLIFIKKIKNKIFFKKKKKKNKNLILSYFCSFCFHKKFNYLLFLNFNFFNKDFVFYKKYFFNILYEKDTFIINCYKNIFFLKYFIQIINYKLHFKKFFLFNKFYSIFFKKNLIFNYNKSNVFFKKIKKVNFVFFYLNLKKYKKKLYFFFKINIKIIIFVFNNFFFIKKIRKNIYVKTKIFYKIGEDFSSYIKFIYLKKKFINNKIKINYCLKNKIIKINTINKSVFNEKYLKIFHLLEITL
ncbi:hypothetical protein [Candidatus Carsonella ruddii]|uniref:Uncharacterized protein n=1 Tax=Candidatus Carsonella ruddii HC isolate Thao2000 TaxID=1202538 RepID=J3TED4_CARRU|nr:hypothetical protein [Candidatus Carsonella ruddii]AFP84047.1 hypothetical protein A353_0223 [Candidatus Carsonella ruddii HC isolate Thao2000]